MPYKYLSKIIFQIVSILILSQNCLFGQLLYDDSGLMNVDRLHVYDAEISESFDIYSNNPDSKKYFDKFKSKIKEYYRYEVSQTLNRANIKNLTKKEWGEELLTRDKILKFEIDFETVDNLYRKEGVVFYRMVLYKYDLIEKEDELFTVISYMNSKDSHVRGKVFVELINECKSEIDELLNEFLISYYEVNR